MKKKILIINNNLEIGGVQKALVNMLNEIHNEYDITLFLFANVGEYKSQLPQGIKVIEGNPFLQLLGISQAEAKKRGIFWWFVRGMYAFWTRKLFNNKIPFKFLIMFEKELATYDYGISYLHSLGEKSFYGGCNEFLLKKVVAKEKITFIHCDYLHCGANTSYNSKLYSKFDKIVAVSEGCRQNFIKAIPGLQDRVYCIRNFNDYSSIIRDADDTPVIYDKDYYNIITVSRLAEEKGIIRCISVIKNLLQQGIKVKWHIVGEGKIRTKIEELIKKEHMEEDIILYGNQINPYRYMKNADLFLLPSYHEAAPMVFDEAKCLDIPILATKTTSTKEMVEECMAGWVCENDDAALGEKLKYILGKRENLEVIKHYQKEQVFTNQESVKQFSLVLAG